MSRVAVKKKVNAKATGAKMPIPDDRLLERVRRGERVVIRRGKKPVAAVIPFEDLKFFEELEDRLDVKAAEKAEEEAREKGTISLADLKKELGF